MRSTKELMNNSHEFFELTKEKQKALVIWCSSISKTKNINKLGKSSYGLKHVFEYSENGFYITNGMFKGAMIEAGFEHTDGINWYFNYSHKSLKAIMKNDKKYKSRYQYL